MAKEKDIDLGGGAFARSGRRRKHLKVIHTLYESNTRDVPRTLRKIARSIEKGEVAMPNEAALIIDSANGNYDIYGFGPHYADMNSTLTLFVMGKEECVSRLYDTKKEQAETYEPPPPKKAG